MSSPGANRRISRWYPRAREHERHDYPSGWAVVGAWIAAVVCNALLDNTDDGDPAALLAARDGRR
jgi:hypothetical protein